MKQPIWLLFSLTAIGLSQLTSIQPTVAQNSNISDVETINLGPPLIEGLTSGGGITGTPGGEGEGFGLNSSTGELGIPPNVFDAISRGTAPGSVRRSTNTGDGSGSPSLGTQDDNQTGNAPKVTICASDPCVPADGTDSAITLNDLAKLIEDDLSQSYEDLLAAEKLERELAERPRRVIKRRSSNSCAACMTCANPVEEARQEFTRKLENSRQFIETTEQLRPESSIW